MSRFLLLLAFCLAPLQPLLALEENPTQAKVRLAKDAYYADRDKAEAALIALLTRRVDSAKKAGDLKAFEAVQAELNAFRSEGTLPKLVPLKDYETAMKLARVKYENILTAGIKALTQFGNIEDAKALDQQLKEFQAQGSAKSDTAVATKGAPASKDTTPTKAATPIKGAAPGGKADAGSLDKLYQEDKDAELAPGWAVIEFPHNPNVQPRNSAIPPQLLGTPVNFAVSSSSEVKQHHDRNGLIVGYLKIEKAGEHLFGMGIWGGSAIVYINGKELIPYKKERFTAKVDLPAGYAQVVILTYVRKEGDKASLKWFPPGDNEMEKIPDNVMLHRPPTAEWLKTIPMP